MLRFIFVLWCLIIPSVSIFGQTLEADLKGSFNKYSVVKIDDQEALKKAKNQQPFKLETKDKFSVYFNAELYTFGEVQG